MIVSHQLGRHVLIREGQAASAILSDNGSYLSIGLNSAYNGGFFMLKGRLLKVVDEIGLPGKITRLTNKISSIEAVKEDILERFYLKKDALIYELSKPGWVRLVLDVREPYDSRSWGKNYEISKIEDRLLIRYTKRADFRDGDKGTDEEYSLFIAIKSSHKMDYRLVDDWLKKEYIFDKNRGSQHERYVYHAIDIFADKLVLSIAENKEDALSKACFFQSKRLNPIDSIKNKEILVAYNCAINSITGLTVEDNSICAGLPWFFQFWLRDESISVRSLIDQGRLKTALNILDKQLSFIKDGSLPTIPGSSLPAMDALGWHFIGWQKLFTVLKGSDKQKIIDKLEIALIDNLNNFSKDGLAANSSKETWMDSLDRSGARIEMQALRLSMHRFLAVITKKRYYSKLENNLRVKVRASFMKDNYLIDGIGDETVRPNIFIAAYVYPHLLTKKEWVACFEKVLPKLWLDWGGLATVDKESGDFHDAHTGQAPASYHNGDSWFWINNLAALVMYRINKERFKPYIEKIIDASTGEILWKGFIGHHSELSSAKELKSEGCLCQAWSSAMYLELIKEVYSLT